MSTDNAKNDIIYTKRKIKKEDTYSFIKLAALTNSIFEKNINLNASIGERGSSLQILSDKEIEDDTEISFFVGHEKLIISTNKHSEISVVGTQTVTENPNFIYEKNSILLIKDMKFKSTGVAKEFVVFEVLPNNIEFILSHVNHVFEVELLKNSLSIMILLDKTSEDKIIVKAKILKDSKDFKKHVKEINQVKKDLSFSFKSEIFKQFDLKLATI